MKSLIDIQRFKIYLWLGLAYLAVWQFSILSSHPETYGVRLINGAWLAIPIVFLNYIFFEYTLNQATLKRIFWFLFLVFAHFMLISFGLHLWRYTGIQLGIYTSLREYASIKEAAGYHTSFGISALIFFAVIRHVYLYIKLKRDTQKLLIEKQQAELNYLKSQTNPHFLFNTLNNIYSLARDKSDLAPESVLRLSKILRFMLYETSGEYIAVDQEIKIIGDYIELEKLRYDDSLHINLNHDIEDMKQALPPLLLIPLVENAFKHGVSETRHQPFVDIHLSIKQRQLTFIIRNSSETYNEGEHVKENIGLSNLRRQLELLYKDYNLSVRQENGVFTANLKINLASHV